MDTHWIKIYTLDSNTHRIITRSLCDPDSLTCRSRLTRLQRQCVPPCYSPPSATTPCSTWRPTCTFSGASRPAPSPCWDQSSSSLSTSPQVIHQSVCLSVYLPSPLQGFCLYISAFNPSVCLSTSLQVTDPSVCSSGCISAPLLVFLLHCLVVMPTSCVVFQVSSLRWPATSPRRPRAGLALLLEP